MVAGQVIGEERKMMARDSLPTAGAAVQAEVSLAINSRLLEKGERLYLTLYGHCQQHC